MECGDGWGRKIKSDHCVSSCKIEREGGMAVMAVCDASSPQAFDWNKAQWTVYCYILTPMPQRLLQLCDDSHSPQESFLPSLPDPLPLSYLSLHHKYYLEFRKIHLTAFRLQTELQKVIASQLQLQERIAQIETHMTGLGRRRRQEQDGEGEGEGEEEGSEGGKERDRGRGGRRNRRTAQEIVRKFECPSQYCDRCYGSDGSLQQHLKLKHPELYLKQEGNAFYS